MTTSSSDNELSRRQVGELSIASVGLLTSFLGTRENKPDEYGLWGILPVGTYKTKKTLFETLEEGKIWTATQKFGILNVQVPLRMTILRLTSENNEKGGLFIYNPIAATPEVVSFVKDLESKYGEVKHIVLGSVALEHKVYSSVFSQKFKKAQVWLQPGQYSFPVKGLPESFLGFPAKRTKFIPNAKIPGLSAEIPKEWKDSGLEYEMLGPYISRDGAFGETVFYHKSTKTLMVTDTVIEVTDEVPKIFDIDPKPLLYHARNTITDIIEDNEENRKIGWRRIALFGLFFQPEGITIKSVGEALEERRPDINSDFAGIYPWDWIGDKDQKSFEAIKGGLFVAPILQKLILNRNPIETLEFADRVSKWDIARIIPAHFRNDIKGYNGSDYRQAFSFLEVSDGSEKSKNLPKPLDGDFQTLVDAEVNLIKSGAISVCPPLVGAKGFSREDIIAQSAYGCRSGICTPKADS